MTPEEVLEIAIIPAYELLPGHMASARATAMLLAIGLQESRFEHRRQIVNRAGGGFGVGPARGFWQFEPGGGVRGVRHHGLTNILARQILIERDCDPKATDHAVCERLANDDVLAACFARLLLWTLPYALPGPDEPEGGWHQYIAAWRPGKPHRSTWDAFYARAWDTQRASTD